MLRGRSSEAFVHEIQLRFFAGFLGKRLTDQKASRAAGPNRDSNFKEAESGKDSEVSAGDN